MMTPGERMAAEARERLDRLHFYVDSLTNIERSKLAARYLKRFNREQQLHLLKNLNIPQLAFCEVFASEIYGW